MVNTIKDMKTVRDDGTPMTPEEIIAHDIVNSFWSGDCEPNPDAVEEDVKPVNHLHKLSDKEKAIWKEKSTRS